MNPDYIQALKEVVEICDNGLYNGDHDTNSTYIQDNTLRWVRDKVLDKIPLEYSCFVSSPKGDIYRGDVVTITGIPKNLIPGRDTEYFWTNDAGPILGTSNVASIDTLNFKPRMYYEVKGHVQQGPLRQADCKCGFYLKEAIKENNG